MRVLGWIACNVLNNHVWTCRTKDGLGIAEEDRPVSGDSSVTIAEKFKRYATMYCRRCRKVYCP